MYSQSEILPITTLDLNVLSRSYTKHRHLIPNQEDIHAQKLSDIHLISEALKQIIAPMPFHEIVNIFFIISMCWWYTKKRRNHVLGGTRN